MKKWRISFPLKGLLTILMCVIAVSGFAQTKTVKGAVVDKQNEPLIGVAVVIQGTAIGAATDFNGEFTIPNVPENAILEVSFIGMRTQLIPVAGSTVFKIVLEDDSELLEDVVVVAFGTQKKENLTGAVSAVSAKELTSRPVNNVVEALQGVVPGMNISTGTNGGSLNSSKRMNIRGIGTIGAGSSVSPLVLIDGMEGDMNMLNPNDIESISVLKDAAASSIYGSRAPGGVILITTKKGKSGKTIVNYNNSFRFNSPLNMPEVADSYRFALAINDQQLNGGGTPMYSANKLQQILDYQQGKSTQYMWDLGGRWNSFDDPSRLDIMPTANTNWLKTHFGNSFSEEHSISANGGNETTQYYLSGNYLNQDGLLKYGDDNKQRYSFSGRINSQLNKWLNVQYTARFSRTDYDAPSFTGGDNISGNVFYFDMVRYWPVIPVVDPNGYYNQPSKIEQIKNGGREILQNDELTQQLAFVVEPIKDWKTHFELNYRVNNNFTHRDYQTVYAHDVNGNPFAIANEVSSVSEYAYKSNFFNPNIFSEYSTLINDSHSFKGMIGFQSELFKNRNLYGEQNDIIAGVPTLNTTVNTPYTDGGYNEWATVGFFGRINYNYKERYLVEANLRYDGTSRFLDDQRWNWFPSFSAGWNIAREAFFEDYTHIVNNMKLRASWGELGNQNTDNWYPFYRTMGLGTANGGWLINGKRPNTSYESALVSSSLTWEKTQTLDLGFDLSTLNNRLNLSFDWFQRKSLDMVGPAPELPNILGINPPRVNNLDMTSKGWELQVTWRDAINDFKYGVALSLSDNTVTIDKYSNPSNSFWNSGGGVMYYPGAKIGDIWGYTTIGIAKTDAEMQNHLNSLNNGGQSALGSNWGAGDIMYKDLNNDGKIDAGTRMLSNKGDVTKIGNSTPRYNFGLNLDGSFKNFDLKVFVQGTLKRDYMPGSGTTLFWGSVGYWQTNFFKPHLDYFRPEGTTTALGTNTDSYFPRPLENGRNRNPQTRYMQNAAYARLKNVTLGYTLPKTITDKVKIANLRLFVSGENLLTVTDLIETFDPETVGIGDWDGATYPLSKTFSFGLSVTF